MSNKSKHTPGPWEVKTYKSLDHKKDKYLYDVISPMCRILTAHKTEDAQLIAAAPEMFEVLKEIIDTLDLHASYTDDWKSKELRPDTIKDIRETIKKARGE